MYLPNDAPKLDQTETALVAQLRAATGKILIEDDSASVASAVVERVNKPKKPRPASSDPDAEVRYPKPKGWRQMTITEQTNYLKKHPRPEPIKGKAAVVLAELREAADREPK